MKPSTSRPTQREATCAPSPSGASYRSAPGTGPLFPPKHAGAEARRRWLATCPWPEVVFASAGA